MNLTTLLSNRAATRLEQRARHFRRALRDHLREESSRIRDLEVRARGLRLYAAWSRKPSAKTTPSQSPEWQTFAKPSLA